MESFLRYWLEWPVVIRFLEANSWAWPLCETAHFMGLILLIGGVGLFDLRILGVAKGIPFASLRALLPWGVFGFILCVVSGSVFVTGVRANIGMHPYDVLMNDIWLQLKLLFIALAGVNLLAFYGTGMSRTVDALGAHADAPGLAKVIAATSLVLWVSIIYFGRLIPWAL